MSERGGPNIESKDAPGSPGCEPHWAVGEKTGVGTALSAASNVWFTLGAGIVTEIFFPSVDMACTRELQFVVTGPGGFFATEREDTDAEATWLVPGVPAYRVINTCKRRRFRIEKTILSDSRRSALLLKVRFEALDSLPEDYRLFVFANPHLGNLGAGNEAWLEDFKGMPMLFARRGGSALALACSAPWRERSVGFAGVSDGLSDLREHGELTRPHQSAAKGNGAAKGNVLLAAEIDLRGDADAFTFVVAFGQEPGDAGHCARAALLQGFEDASRAYSEGWSRWLRDMHSLVDVGDAERDDRGLFRISAAVLRTHEDKHLPGALVASLAVPWGETRDDDDRGYHLVWPRDLIESVGGQLAAGKHEDARRVLFYLLVTQEADGHWPQNMFLDGQPYWKGTQLDETGFVLLLAEMLRREGALDTEAVVQRWPQLRLAASYLVRQGPVTPMDRWEEKPGYYASTLAVEIPALLVAADFADVAGEPEVGTYLRETADAWNDAIEPLLYVTGNALCREVGVDGYYARLALPDQMQAGRPAAGTIDLPNHPRGKGRYPVADIVSPDALALVRFGLRAADDPRIVNTVQVIDRSLRVELPSGPCWHRYSQDGYGEHADGQPYDGTGIGRLWPLLTGERAHYELAAGNRGAALRLLQAMESFANASGLLPEQIWDSEAIPERGLFRGRPTGSATPLVWAHAEYVKLRRSLHDGRIFDMPPQGPDRYLSRQMHSTHVVWRPKQRWRAVPPGKTLRLEFAEPTTVRWRLDGAECGEEQAVDTGLGVHKIDLPTEHIQGRIEVSWHADRSAAGVPETAAIEIREDPVWTESGTNRSELVGGVGG